MRLLLIVVLLLSFCTFVNADAVVTSLADDWGAGTLRRLIQESNGNETLTFGVEGTITIDAVRGTIAFYKPNIIVDARGSDVILDAQNVAAGGGALFVSSEASGCQVYGLKVTNFPIAVTIDAADFLFDNCTFEGGSNTTSVIGTNTGASNTSILGCDISASGDLVTHLMEFRGEGVMLWSCSIEGKSVNIGAGQGMILFSGDDVGINTIEACTLTNASIFGVPETDGRHNYQDLTVYNSFISVFTEDSVIENSSFYGASSLLIENDGVLVEDCVFVGPGTEFDDAGERCGIYRTEAEPTTSISGLRVLSSQFSETAAAVKVPRLSYGEFSNLTMTNVGDVIALEIASSYCTIEGSTITGMDGNGIEIYGSNNLVSDCTIEGVSAAISAIRISSPTGSTGTNNVVRDVQVSNAGHGIVVSAPQTLVNDARVSSCGIGILLVSDSNLVSGASIEACNQGITLTPGSSFSIGSTPEGNVIRNSYIHGQTGELDITGGNPFSRGRFRLFAIDDSSEGYGTKGIYNVARQTTIEGVTILKCSMAGIWDSGVAVDIKNCYIGTDVNHAANLGNFYGILSMVSSDGYIGGISQEGNIICGNRFGISLTQTTNNQINGNFIGTDRSESSTLGNVYGISLLRANSNVVGGATQGQGNIIANNNTGILLLLSSVESSACRNNVVAENDIASNERGVIIAASYPETLSAITGEAQISAEANNITGNLGYGVSVETTGRYYDFKNSWWQASSGPYHADQNSSGTGQTVSDYVLFDPWAASSVTSVANMPSTTKNVFIGNDIRESEKEGVLIVDSFNVTDLTLERGGTANVEPEDISSNVKSGDKVGVNFDWQAEVNKDASLDLDDYQITVKLNGEPQSGVNMAESSDKTKITLTKSFANVPAGENEIEVLVSLSESGEEARKSYNVNVETTATDSATAYYPGAASGKPFSPGEENLTVAYQLTEPAEVGVYIISPGATPVYSSKTTGVTGYNQFVWDGKDLNGHQVGVGIYTIYIRHGSTTKKIKVAVGY